MNSDDEIITKEMLAPLPEPVQRCLTFVGVVGKPKIKTVRLKQFGRFRQGSDQPWMAMTADQTYTTNPPGFVWNARFKVAGVTLLRARDCYENGEGHMFARLAWVFPIFDVRGDELTQGTMVRYLQEMIWFPAAFLEPYIEWMAVDNNSAEVKFTDHGKSVSGTMLFDDVGRVVDFKAERYREIDGRFQLDQWSTPVETYGVLAGLNLPTRGKAIWHLDDGDLSYVDLEIQEVQYNLDTE